MEKVERSFQEQHGGKYGSRKNKKISTVASSKLVASRRCNRDKLLGDQLDKSQQQSNMTQVSKLHQVPVTKGKLQKTARPCPSVKVPLVYSLRSKNPKTEGPPSYNLSKGQKTGNQNASVNIQNKKPPKKDTSKDSSITMQKRGILKNSTQPIKKTETPKRLTASQTNLRLRNHQFASQHELFSREPVYHIRWEGEDVKNELLGQKCILCDKDLACATEDDDDDDSEYDDDFQYDGDQYDFNPPLLPTVDILSCGHAYHTKCLQKDALKEHLSDPRCILGCKTS